MATDSKSKGSGLAVIRTDSPAGQHVLKGIPASPGLAIGQAYVLNVITGSTSPEKISPEAVPAEVHRFDGALDGVVAELVRAAELASKESATVVSIIESFLLIVSDPIVTSAIKDRICHGVSAEAAVIDEYDTAKATLKRANDAFLRERVEDFEHVKQRLLSMLRNSTLAHSAARDRVVVSGSITPQDILFFKQTNTLGYVTEVGGINSHACILARDMAIPAVIGIRSATTVIRPESVLIVDGFAGIVIVDPDDATLAEYVRRWDELEEYRRKLGALISQPSVTQDGTAIKLFVNVDTPDHVDQAVMQGAAGVGLVRTEYLLMQLGRYPSVEEQELWYREIAQRAFPLPVTFRAFDVGSDKFRLGIPHEEDNPALGLRGIRFLLFKSELFEDQVSAVLRASANRNVKLMLPMVSVGEEIDEALKVVHRCKEQLRNANVAFDEAMPVGIMIETPSAALMADTWIGKVDFFSIGTNDLTQYTLATDRNNELVADIYDALHPSVLRLIGMVVAAASRKNVPVSLCGELAGHAVATEMLIGIGIHEFSVSPALLLELKQRIRRAHIDDCVHYAASAVGQTSTADVYNVLSEGRL